MWAIVASLMVMRARLGDWRLMATTATLVLALYGTGWLVVGENSGRNVAQDRPGRGLPDRHGTRLGGYPTDAELAHLHTRDIRSPGATWRGHDPPSAALRPCLVNSTSVESTR